MLRRRKKEKKKTITEKRKKKKIDTELIDVKKIKSIIHISI